MATRGDKESEGSALLFLVVLAGPPGAVVVLRVRVVKAVVEVLDVFVPDSKRRGRGFSLIGREEREEMTQLVVPVLLVVDVFRVALLVVVLTSGGETIRPGRRKSESDGEGEREEGKGRELHDVRYCEDGWRGRI